MSPNTNLDILARRTDDTKYLYHTPKPSIWNKVTALCKPGYVSYNQHLYLVVTVRKNCSVCVSSWLLHVEHHLVILVESAHYYKELAVFYQTVVLATSTLIRTESPCFVSFEYLLQFDLAPCEFPLSCFLYAVYVVSVLWIWETHLDLVSAHRAFGVPKKLTYLGGRFWLSFRGRRWWSPWQYTEAASSRGRAIRGGLPQAHLCLSLQSRQSNLQSSHPRHPISAPHIHHRILYYKFTLNTSSMD